MVQDGCKQNLSEHVAIAADPRAADFVLAALDPDTRDALLPTLWARARERGVAMVVASHDPAVLARCDRVLTLEAP